MGKLELGELQITSLNDIERFDVPLSTIFPEADPNEIKNITWIGPEILSSGLLHLKIRSWLLRLHGKVILIDTCVGANKDRPSWQDWHQRDGVNWLSALAAGQRIFIRPLSLAGSRRLSAMKPTFAMKSKPLA